MLASAAATRYQDCQTYHKGQNYNIKTETEISKGCNRLLVSLRTAYFSCGVSASRHPSVGIFCIDSVSPHQSSK